MASLEAKYRIKYITLTRQSDTVAERAELTAAMNHLEEREHKGNNSCHTYLK